MAIVVLVLWMFTAGAGFYLLVTSNLGRARPASAPAPAAPAPEAPAAPAPAASATASTAAYRATTTEAAPATHPTPQAQPAQPAAALRFGGAGLGRDLFAGAGLASP